MKLLKPIIESLLDDEDDIALDSTADIMVFLNQNYKLEYAGAEQFDQPNGTWWAIQDDGKDIPIVHINGSITVKNKSIKHLTNNLFKFGNICGRFDCSNCKNLKSLEGGPQICAHGFSCEGCTSLKSLEGGPKYVGFGKNDLHFTYRCSDCTSLESLKGAPIGYVKNAYDIKYTEYEGVDSSRLFIDVYANRCNSLKTIDWGIKELYGNLYLINCGLQNLNGAPQIIRERIDISHNKNLTNLKGSLKKVGEGFIAQYCDGLKNLEGCPEMLTKNGKTTYDFAMCKGLKELKGIPSTIHAICLDDCSDLEYLDDLIEVYEISCERCYSIKPYTVVPNAYRHGRYMKPTFYLTGSKLIGPVIDRFMEKGFEFGELMII